MRLPAGRRGRPRRAGVVDRRRICLELDRCQELALGALEVSGATAPLGEHPAASTLVEGDAVLVPEIAKRHGRPV